MGHMASQIIGFSIFLPKHLVRRIYGFKINAEFTVPRIRHPGGTPLLISLNDNTYSSEP